MDSINDRDVRMKISMIPISFAKLMELRTMNKMKWMMNAILFTSCESFLDASMYTFRRRIALPHGSPHGKQ